MGEERRIMQPPTPDDPAMDRPVHTGMPANAVWTRFLTDGEPVFRTIKSVLGRLPSNPRCKVCYAPFTGIGGQLMRWIGKGRARKNPLFCAACEQFVQKNPGGAEVELTMLFVDVRGSTALAETMRAEAFSQLLNRFYAAASTALITCDALIDKFVGDEVIGLFIPRWFGHDRAAG
jgi:adenylate cyclase